jgi:hypothetical protein
MQLRRSTVCQANTLTELQYEQVLNNIAMFSCDPYTLPSMVAIKAGTTQAADTGTGGFLPGASTNFFIQPALTGTRTVVGQWATAPITDDTSLELLQMAYRNAFGFGEEMGQKKANDLAHTLIGQVPTTADTSIEANVIAGVIEKNLPVDKPVPGVRIVEDGDNITVRVIVPAGVTVTRVWSEQKSVVVVGTRPQDAAAKGTDGGAAHCAGAGCEFYLDVPLPTLVAPLTFAKPEALRHDCVLEVPLVKCRTNSTPECPEQIAQAWCHDPIGGDDWQSEPFPTGNGYAASGQRVADQFFAVMQSLSDTLDWRILECSPHHPSYFICYGMDRHRVPSGLSQEVVYEVNDAQQTLKEIPSGWFSVGCKHDVPRSACYVGRFRDRYTWVDARHTKQLADFTRAVLKLSTLIKDKAVVNAPSGVQFSPSVTR